MHIHNFDITFACNRRHKINADYIFIPVTFESMDLNPLKNHVGALALVMLARVLRLSQYVEAAHWAIKDRKAPDHFMEATLMQFAPVANDFTAFMNGWSSAQTLCTNGDELYPFVGPQFFGDIREAVQAHLPIK